MQYLDGGSYHALTERKKERTHCYICLLNIFITFRLHLQMQYCIALVKKTKKKKTLQCYNITRIHLELLYVKQ